MGSFVEGAMRGFTAVVFAGAIAGIALPVTAVATGTLAVAVLSALSEPTTARYRRVVRW